MVIFYPFAEKPLVDEFTLLITYHYFGDRLSGVGYAREGGRSNLAISH